MLIPAGSSIAEFMRKPEDSLAIDRPVRSPERAMFAAASSAGIFMLTLIFIPLRLFAGVVVYILIIIS